MTAELFFHYFQIVFAITAGLLIVSRLRKKLRSLVVRFMPVKQRLADNFLPRQTRYSAVAGIVLTALIAITLFVGMEYLEQKVTTSQEITLSVSNAQDKTPLSKTTLSTPPEQPPQAKEEQETPTPSRDESSQYYPSSSVMYYLQLQAFENPRNALKQEKYWTQRLNEPVTTKNIPGDNAPYKILVGPFPSRQAVMKYRSSTGLPGFIRKID